jgi:hypothetical protein
MSLSGPRCPVFPRAPSPNGTGGLASSAGRIGVTLPRRLFIIAKKPRISISPGQANRLAPRRHAIPRRGGSPNSKVAGKGLPSGSTSRSQGPSRLWRLAAGPGRSTQTVRKRAGMACLGSCVTEGVTRQSKPRPAAPALLRLSVPHVLHQGRPPAVAFLAVERHERRPIEQVARQAAGHRPRASPSSCWPRRRFRRPPCARTLGEDVPVGDQQGVRQSAAGPRGGRKQVTVHPDSGCNGGGPSRV